MAKDFQSHFIQKRNRRGRSLSIQELENDYINYSTPSRNTALSFQ